MATFYLIRGNQIVAELEAGPTDVIGLSLPLFGGGDAVSMLNAAHAQMVGIALALGYSEAQLWGAMHG